MGMVLCSNSLNTMLDKLILSSKKPYMTTHSSTCFFESETYILVAIKVYLDYNDRRSRKNEKIR